MALLVRARMGTKLYTFTSPSLLCRHLSTSGSDGGGDQPPSKSNSPFSSLFREVQGSLKQRSPSPSKSQNASPFNEIMKSLSEYRVRTAVPPPGESPPPQQFSFQETYNRNVQQKTEQHAVQPQTTDFEAIRKSLRSIRGGKGGGGVSLPSLRDSLKPKPAVIGGTSALPEAVFGKEIREKKDGDVSPAAMKWAFMRTYQHEELGEKLRKLRPQGVEKGRDWFSLKELNERLVRLREMEENKAYPDTQEANVFKDIKETLVNMQLNKEDQSKQASMQRLHTLGEFGGTQTYLLQPPKEHLVEKYFHPDNMSSAEKLKIELSRVREEFKMSESDCGSARVQIAQLTTKIKHLSAVLHKKDVHSRKGLLAMVQKRKRLLKYLRRTDWDSYCFVISKLGLRDNPDHSYKIRTSKSGVAASA